MKKKVSQKVKVSASKPNKNKKVTKPSGSAASNGAKVKKPSAPKPDPAFQQAVQNFEAGMKLMQERKFERAQTAFEKVMTSGIREFGERSRVYINACAQQLAKTSTNFKTPEEHYDYAVSLVNGGDYEGARSHLDKILRQHPKADYAHYGLALLACLTNQIEESLRSLEQAIKLNPSNRFTARNDSDFANMADDPRFTELLYPEPSEAPSAKKN
jgi:tetratricopeptide (TPR) repeat protein